MTSDAAEYCLHVRCAHPLGRCAACGLVTCSVVLRHGCTRCEAMGAAAAAGPYEDERGGAQRRTR